MDVFRNGEIYLFGTVGEGLFAEGFTALNVVDALARVGRNKKAVVHINSPGGYTDEGVAIHSILTAHPGGVETIIEGGASSMASLIAMAGERIVMRPGTTMMIHDPSGITMGTSDEHAKAIEYLEMTAESMAEIYAARTDKDPDEVRADMKEEIWMTADEAVEAGYADEVKAPRGRATKKPEVIAFDYRLFKRAPQHLVALARKNDWRLEGASSEPSSSRVRKGTSHMTKKTGAESTERTEAEQAEYDAAVAAGVTAALAAKATKDEADAKAAKALKDAADAAEAAKLKPVAGSPEEAVAAERKRASDIMAACALVGKASKAVAFIAEGKSLSDVVTALQADRSAADASETTNRSGPSKEEAAQASTAWKRVTDKVNARVPA